MQDSPMNTDHPDADTRPAQKLVSQLDADGFFLGPILADVSPLEPGIFLIPGGAIDVHPPQDIVPGRVYRLSNRDSWESVQDYRQITLYRTSDGGRYQLGSDHNGRSFSGIGECPDWLTRDARPNTWSVWTGTSWEADESLLAIETTRTRSEMKTSFIAMAAQAIAPLQDAEDLGISTDAERALLTRWKRYRVELTRLDPAEHDTPWPEMPA